MNHPHFDLVCIGSGPAGQRAAIQAAKLGRRAAVIEKRRVIGGICLDTGTIPSKTLREAVLAFRRRQPDGRPAATDLLARVEDVIRRESEVIADQLARNGVELLRGTASFVDPHTLRIQGDGPAEQVTADHVLIAVGTTPLAPPGGVRPGLVITSDEVGGLETLPRRLVVVGAGVIGLEYASMFAEIGVNVTVVDRFERPLPFLDREIVDELLHQMRNRNVSFRFGESVDRLETVDDNQPLAALHLESGKTLVGDLVLFSTGRVAATEALNLAKAGLKADARGRLQVDAAFRTSVPHISAAGDVIGYPALAATSMDQGRLAACAMFHDEPECMADHFPVGIYAIPEISMVGRTEQELTEARIPYEVGVARYREIARGHILQDDSGFFKMLFHRETRQLLGVHAIGTGATELIHIGQAVLGLGGGLDYFLSTVFNYPTLAECYKTAALDAANKLAMADRLAQARRGPEPSERDVDDLLSGLELDADKDEHATAFTTRRRR